MGHGALSRSDLGLILRRMMWLRRVLSVPLVLLLFAALLIALVLLQVRSKLLDPGFYTAKLLRTNVYQFTLNDALATVLDETREAEAGTDADRGPLIASGLSTPEIVASVNRALPPVWLQSNAEQVFEQFGKYMTGHRGEFEVRIRAGDQTFAVTEEIEYLLREADLHSLLFEYVEPEIERAAAEELPRRLNVTSEQLVQSARRVVTTDWTQQQLDYILDEVVPYLVGDRDTFEINVALADRAEAALGEVKVVLRDANSYEVLYAEVIEAEVMKTVPEGVDLGDGITLADEDIIAALRSAASVEWMREQAEHVIDRAAPYVTGKEDGFTVVISIHDNKSKAAASLKEVVRHRLGERIYTLPPCAGSRPAGDQSGLPSCIPAGVSRNELADGLGGGFSDLMLRVALAPIPDTIRLDERSLIEAIERFHGDVDEDLIDRTRETVRDGWTYTHEDLRRDLASARDGPRLGGIDPADMLDGLRDFLDGGLTYTEADLRLGNADTDNGQALDDWDAVRRALKLVESYWWLGSIPVAPLIVAIGLLGGRGWRGRIAWSAGALLTSSVLVLITSGLLYGSIEPIEELRVQALDEVRRDASAYPQTAWLVTDKLFDVAASVADDFAAGVAASARNLAILGLLVMTAALFWPRIVAGYRAIAAKLQPPTSSHRAPRGNQP